MKRIISLIAAGFFAFAVFGGLACATKDTGKTTPSPSASPTAEATRSGMLQPSASPSTSPSASPSASPSVSPSPDGSAEPSLSPNMSPGSSFYPSTTPGTDELIDGFMEGRVIDPSEIPEIAAHIGREFPEHTIQSVTHALFEGRQAYRVVLQGDGELSRVLFVFPDGNMLLPAAAD